MRDRQRACLGERDLKRCRERDWGGGEGGGWLDQTTADARGLILMLQ